MGLKNKIKIEKKKKKKKVRKFEILKPFTTCINNKK